MTCLRYISLNVLILIASGLMGQQCETLSFGNTYIHAGGEANVFGRHTFAEGSMGVIPGIVGTERAGVMGVLSFAEVSPGWIGAGDDTHVDGYVRSYRNGGFVFPIGDNGSYRPAATQGDGVVTAAYFGIDPSLAVTTDLFGGDFPILPIGGPFPSAATSGDLFRVSQQEYWDIDSDSLQQITLTWDIFSNINNLTGGDLNRLSIVGYDGSQWVAIPSSLDVLFLNDQSTTPQFNAGISSRVQGSITTTGSVRPNDFLAFTFGAVASGFIGDFVWDDLNRNGVQEQGEPGIPGTLIRLFDDRDNLVDSIRSDANGRYTFQGVPPGRYYLAFTPPDGYNVTLPGQGLADLNSDIGFNSETFVFLLGANKIDFSLDAGFYRSASIGNLVWLDSNGDGIQGDDELNVPQVRVDLLNPNGDLLASTISDEFGFYQFTNVPPGSYQVTFELPEGFGYALYRATPDTTLDSNIDPMTGMTDMISLISGEANNTIDIGLSQECQYIANATILPPSCGQTDGEIQITITGDTGPYNFDWSHGDSVQVATSLDTGSYTLVITDSRLCTRAFNFRVDYPDECEMQCIALQTQVFLEGPYDTETGQMRTKLNELGYLPGQRPTTFFGRFTEAGQPYTPVPFNYLGEEGIDEEAASVADNNDYYPIDATDWVLVSLRVNPEEEYETCTRAGILLSDGTILFDESDCCLVDPSKEYYVVIEHRNHLIVMSPTPLPVVNGEIQYDFRNNGSFQRLFGFTQKEVDTDVFAMYASNGDQYLNAESPVDINVSDLSEWLKENGLNSSYYFMDFDLNGDANVQDKGLYLKNIGVFTDVPKQR